MIEPNTIKALNEIREKTDEVIMAMQAIFISCLVEDLVYKVVKHINECNATKNTADEICINEESEE